MYNNIKIGIQFELMYRRNMENVQAQPHQTFKFSILKKKNQPCLQFQPKPQKPNQFQLSNIANAPLFLASVASLFYNANKNTNKPSKKVKFFSDCTIENAPKQFQSYQHENTLQQIMGILQQYCVSLEQLQEVLTNYPISQFVINCYGRHSIFKYIEDKQPQSFSYPQQSKTNFNSSQQSNFQIIEINSTGNIATTSLDLMGNQKQLLEDYNIQLRGNLLQILCNSLGVQMTVIYKDVNNDQYVQEYGDKANQIKIGISSNQNGYLCEFMNQNIVPKLNAANSPNQVTRRKQSDQLDTTLEVSDRTKHQSKSANKDHLGKCKVCGSKARFCDCERKKGMVTPKVVNNNSSRQTPKSIFDSLSYNNVGRVNRNNEQTTAKKTCHCHRNVCVCK